MHEHFESDVNKKHHNLNLLKINLKIKLKLRV